MVEPWRGRRGSEGVRGGTGARALECFERPRAALSPGLGVARWLPRRMSRGRGPFRGGKPALCCCLGLQREKAKEEEEPGLRRGQACFD